MDDSASSRLDFPGAGSRGVGYKPYIPGHDNVGKRDARNNYKLSLTNQINYVKV